MILACIFSLGMLFNSVTYEQGCMENTPSAACGAPSCVSESQKKESEAFCNSHGCGGCTEPKLHDSCYEKLGYCQKQGKTCDWKNTPELEACIKKADALDEACLIKHGGNNCYKDKTTGIYMNCMMDTEYSNCLKDEKKKL